MARGEVSGEGDHVEVVLTDMQFDPFEPTIRFAVGEGGAFMTLDGVTWSRLLDTGGLPGRPVNCYYDRISAPTNRALYVAFAGRSIVRISPLPLPVVLLRTVPDLFEVSAALARQAVLAEGLVPKFKGAQGARAWVSSQSPVAGERVPVGSTVTMVLRLGPIP